MHGRLEHAGGVIAYDVLGSGPPLLLVSGLGGLASFWRSFAERCAERFTVVLHDHRGVGRSSRCLGDYSVAGMAEDVIALMDHIGIERATMVGHSTGGAIGQVLAARCGERVARLVLSASWARSCAYFRRLFQLRLELLDRCGLAAYRRHAALIAHPPAWIAAHEVALAAEFDETDADDPIDAAITRRRIAAVLAHDMRDELGAIACPTLVIVASDDMVTPAYHSRDLAARIAGAMLVELPRGGHFLPRTEPEAYAGAVLPFLLQETLGAA